MTSDKRNEVRRTLGRLGMHATPEQVVAAMEQYGVEVSEKLVSQVKAQLLRDDAKAVRERSKRVPKSKSHKRPQQRKIPRRG